MSERTQRRPLVVVGVTVVALLAAVAAFLAWELAGDSSDSGSGLFDSSEQAAVDAASTNVANLSSFRRAHFDADFQRALNGLTGAVETNFEQKKAAYKQAIVTGKFDLTAKVTHVALIGATNAGKVDGYDVLVSFNGYRSTQLSLPSQQNLRVSMIQKSGKWVIGDLTSIGVG